MVGIELTPVQGKVYTCVHCDSVGYFSDKQQLTQKHASQQFTLQVFCLSFCFCFSAQTRNKAGNKERHVKQFTRHLSRKTPLRSQLSTVRDLYPVTAQPRPGPSHQSGKSDTQDQEEVRNLKLT